MDKLSKALDDVLTMAHLPSKKKAALEWCDEQGVEQLIDILEGEQTNDFINALKVKECRKAEILNAIQDVLLRAGAFRLERPRADGYASGKYTAYRVRGGHLSVPPLQWGLTVDQFNYFLEYKCVKHAETWRDLETTGWVESCGVLGETPEGAGYVTGLQVYESFVKPYTTSTRCSVALSYNALTPVKAKMLVSHAWSESILEVQEAVNDRARTGIPGQQKNPCALSIWIRLFSVYDIKVYLVFHWRFRLCVLSLGVRRRSVKGRGAHRNSKRLARLLTRVRSSSNSPHKPTTCM